MTDPDRKTLLRENLRWLLARERLSQRQAAEALDVPYKWMRRLCHGGLERQDRRTAEKLTQLARFFGLTVDDLWCADLQQRFQPRPSSVLIKWMGSKRRQADRIIEFFPAKIRTYYEPFVGSGAVLYRLLTSDIEVEKIRCSDLCPPLIGIWKLVQQEPKLLASRYEELWREFQSGGKEFYYRLRDRFNETGDPCEFFFLLRTCRNGMPCFNSDGKFNSPYHWGGYLVPPEVAKSVINDWHEKLGRAKIKFSCRDYGEVRSEPGDFLYLDPPYSAAVQRLYYGPFDLERFFRWVGRQKGGYAMSFGHDGSASVPPSLFDTHVLLESGLSPTRRLGGAERREMVDGLYVRTFS